MALTRQQVVNERKQREKNLPAGGSAAEDRSGGRRAGRPVFCASYVKKALFGNGV